MHPLGIAAKEMYKVVALNRSDDHLGHQSSPKRMRLEIRGTSATVDRR